MPKAASSAFVRPFLSVRRLSALANGDRSLTGLPVPFLPGAAMLLADLAQQAGLPPGVLNIVHGSQDVVNMICDDKAIRAISFVGSDRVGIFTVVCRPMSISTMIFRRCG
jgi:acyl-CoA reductase-like NAD-dependent aldehyde dehydrogenase